MTAADVRDRTDSAPLRRLPPRSLLARLLRSVPSVMALVGVGVASSAVPGMTLGPWVWLIVVPLVLAHLADPVHAHVTFAIAMDPDHLVVRTGLLHRRERLLRWGDVGTVQRDASWWFRAFGLCELTLHPGGEDGRLTLHGVPAGTADEMSRHIERARMGSSSSPPDPEPRRHARKTLTASSATRVYRATFFDLALASVTYGQVVALGAATMLSVTDLVRRLGWGDSLVDAMGLPLVVIGTVLVSLAGGVLTAVFRFAGLRASVDADTLIIEHGFASTRRREIGSDALVGVELKRNLVELMAGRVRMTALSLDSQSGLGTNLVLPSLPLRSVHDLIRRCLPELAPPEGSTQPRLAVLRSLATVVLVVSLALATAVLVLALGMPFAVGFLGGGVAAVVTFLGTVLATSRFSRPAPDGPVIATSFAVGLRVRIIAAESIHELDLGALHRRTAVVSLHYFAGRPRTVRAIVVPDHVSEQLIRAAVGGPVRFSKDVTP